MDLSSTLLKKINSKTAQVGVLGLGYVGGSLAEGIAEKGYQVLGFEIDPEKVTKYNHLNLKNLKATLDFKSLKYCDILCVCVPTPVNPDKTPNFKYLESALLTISENLKKGQLIVIESSMAVGTARNALLPYLQQSNLRPGQDFFFAISPERIDPGNSKYKLVNIPKVVAGLEEKSLELVTAFYSGVVSQVIPVSSLESAELTKLLENTFRFVNISLINEIAEYAKSCEIDIWEVVDAASSKPFGFLPHYPGPGIGGYCIPVLPYFMLNDAYKKGLELKIIQAAGEVNEQRPKQIVSKGFAILNGLTNGHAKKLEEEMFFLDKLMPPQGQEVFYHTISKINKGSNGINNGQSHKAARSDLKSSQNPKILLVGVAYKAGSSDIRDSVALKIWQMAEEYGAQVSYHDPFIPQFKEQASLPLTQKHISKQDLIIIATAHKNIPYQVLINSNKPILDTNHILSQYKQANIYQI